MRAVTETREVQNCLKDILASHKGLQHLEYPEEEVAVIDGIESILKRSSLAPCESIPEE